VPATTTASLALVLLGLLLGAVPRPAAAIAEDRVQGPVPGVRCGCRANGRRYELGERACIGTPAGPRLARCRLVQNVTSWEVEAEGCEVSGLDRQAR
jgi:hypothetical protein